MNSLSLKIATLVKKTSPDQTTSIEIMQYALVMILNSILIISVSLGIGLLTGKFFATALALFSFASLRFFSGGRHLRTSTQCNLFSISLCSLIPHIPLTNDLVWGVNIIALMIMIYYAPNPDVNAQVPLHWYPALKIISILMVVANFFIQSPVIGLAFLFQSLTINFTQRRPPN